MRRVSVTLCALVLLLAGWTKAAQAQFTILTVSGNPAPFNVSTAVAGSDPTTLSSSGLTYFLKSKHPAGPTQVTAQLDSPMPAGTTLTLTMNIPATQGTSVGPVALDATPRAILINVDKVNGNTYGMTYTFAATAAAGVVPSQTRTVTLTMSTQP
ncbi:MAG: hypothetical protein ABI969_05745 [bacterium]